ncbi:MAG: CHASE domain-containing protein, partial [Lysobacter sp.]
DRIGALLVLGGPVACLISATVGVATLWVCGVVPRSDIAFHWFTWWVGDSIGVLVVMPVFLAWSAPRELLSRRTKVFATVPVLVLLALVTLLFVRTSALEQQRIQNEFKQRSDRVAHILIQEFAEYSEVLHAIASFYTVTETDVDRDAFRQLVADMLVRQPGLHALSWSPRVTSAQRAAYEQAMRAEGYSQFQIREQGPPEKLVPAAERPEYFPVTYIEPLGRNARALGFDLASEPERRATLIRARTTGLPTTSNRLELVQSAPGLPGILVLAPAYWPAMPRSTPAQRERALRGYASAVLQVDQMITLFLNGLGVHDMRVRLLDLDAPPTERVLYATQAPNDNAGNAAARQGAKGPALTHTAALKVGGRSWLLVFTLAPDYAASHRSLLAWSVLVAGLLFTGLFSAFLLVTLGRTAAVEAQVRQRTSELKQSNDALQVSIAEHARSEAALRTSEHEARAIVATARDAYIAMDEHSRIQDWNGEAENTFGWSHAEAVGRMLADLIIPEHYRDAHASGVANFLTTGEGPIINRRIEIDALHRDGHVFPIELTVWTTPVGSTHRFHAFLHDISQRQRATQRLAAQEAAAAALVESSTLDDAAPKVLQAVCTALG